MALTASSSFTAFSWITLIIFFSILVHHLLTTRFEEREKGIFGREKDCAFSGTGGVGHWYDDSQWHLQQCALFPFDSKKAQKHLLACLQSHTICFAGDSRVRQLFEGLVQFLEPTFSVTVEDRHRNLTYSFSEGDSQILLHFIWAPEVGLSKSKPNIAESIFPDIRKHSRRRECDVVFYSAGLWAMKRGEPIFSIANNVFLMVKELDADDAWQGSSLVWVPVGHVEEEQLWDARKNITNSAIDQFNSRVEFMIRSSDTPLSRTTIISFQSQAPNKAFPSKDGLHFNRIVVKQQVKMLLNFVCESLFHIKSSMRVCCASFQSPSMVQLIFLFVYILFVVLMMFVAGKRYISSYNKRKKHVFSLATTIVSESPKETLGFPKGNVGSSGDGDLASTLAPLFASSRTQSLTNWTKQFASILHEDVLDFNAMPSSDAWIIACGGVSFCMLVLFVCDRTAVFHDTEKEFSWTVFTSGIICIALVFFFSLKPSDSNRILNRQQTEEWKGWMQLIFLLYHYLGASQVLPIYVYIRVCVASYLFLTGYGHYVYFSTKKNFGFQRIGMVLFRVNIFTILLCVTMNEPYQAYYFVPLSTFWFIMVYLTMFALQSLNHSQLAWVKPLLLSCVVEIIWRQVDFEGNHSFFNFIFGSSLSTPFFEWNGSLHEWYFRGGLDRHAASMGMIVAIFVTKSERNSRATTSSMTLHQQFSLLNAGMVLIVIFALVGFHVFAVSCQSKLICNTYHAYLSPIVIIAFVATRNLFPSFRKVHSFVMAGCGKMSLELFLAQYHILLAGDTRSILVFIPGFPLLNACIAFSLLVFTSKVLSTCFGAMCQLLIASKKYVNSSLPLSCQLFTVLYTNWKVFISMLLFVFVIVYQHSEAKQLS
eukprot:m.46784 g.46784  ORF g.46784 m.46784 type:complete len:876 (-) comp7287_c0_seq1:40-2667(-)